jgi:exonuclease SbcD
MKILHSADWHLGKKLSHFSRMEEQQAVMAEIVEIAREEQVDAVLIAGDLYDQINPPVEASELLYQTLYKLSDQGRRAVVAIAGNHDSPDRVEAPDPLARACGILLMGYPDSRPAPFQLDTGLALLRSDAGFAELRLPSGEQLRILATAYANEIRLRRFLGTEDSHQALREALRSHWQSLADRYCDEVGVNVLMAHLLFAEHAGQEVEEPEDEKPILTLGGASAILSSDLPAGNLHYAALGHLHRFQSLGGAPFPALYSSSPLAYSMSEADQEKYVVIIEAEAGKPASWRKRPLHSGKRLLRKSFRQMDSLIAWLQQHPDAWVEVSLRQESYLSAEDQKRIYDSHPGVVAIIPQIESAEGAAIARPEIDLSQNIEQLFADYFRFRLGQAPHENLMSLFREILAENNEPE